MAEDIWTKGSRNLVFIRLLSDTKPGIPNRSAAV